MPQPPHQHTHTHEQATKFRLPSDSAVQAINELKQQQAKAASGENPRLVLERMLAAYQRFVRDPHGTPRHNMVRGFREVTVKYRYGDGTVIAPKWDYYPVPMVHGVCPECFVRAPSQVDWKQGTKPAIYEETLFVRHGNPEADKKLTVFEFGAPDFSIFLDERNRLTVREIIRCPEWKNCGFVVRIENGVARRDSSARRGRGGGPLIIVK